VKIIKMHNQQTVMKPSLLQVMRKGKKKEESEGGRKGKKTKKTLSSVLFWTGSTHPLCRVWGDIRKGKKGKGALKRGQKGPLEQPRPKENHLNAGDLKPVLKEESKGDTGRESPLIFW